MHIPFPTRLSIHSSSMGSQLATSFSMSMGSSVWQVRCIWCNQFSLVRLATNMDVLSVSTIDQRVSTGGLWCIGVRACDCPKLLSSCNFFLWLLGKNGYWRFAPAGIASKCVLWEILDRITPWEASLPLAGEVVTLCLWPCTRPWASSVHGQARLGLSSRAFLLLVEPIFLILSATL